MMDTFKKWVKTVQHPCIQEWGETVVALGASWDSFRHDDKQQIMADLVNGGIPILAARDIVNITTAEVQKNTAPMAIFWDLENMPIPEQTSGRGMTSILKSILAPHGDLIQFRGYTSIGLNLIPQEKRSDLQLSGCQLVDCPHHGQRETADKMIIVDAMHFAYQHPDGATLCFITSDIDNAYMLAVLQQHPQWRTIMIFSGTMQSMLHVNCDIKLRWETDVLKTIYSSHQEEEEESTEEHLEDSIHTTDVKPEQFAPLPADKFWKDDVEVLQNVMIHEECRFSARRTPQKSIVGDASRQANPARFPIRESVQGFFAQAVEQGVVVERGDGPLKTLSLADTPNQHTDSLTVSASSPLPPSELPTKALDLASKGLPFVLFIRKHHCPSGFYPPNKAYIQSTDDWLLLLYPSYGHVLQSIGDHPWLRGKVTLVDWRNMTTRKTCLFCGAEWSEQNYDGLQPEKLFCSAECMEWSGVDESFKRTAVERVVGTLEFLAANDDIYVNQSLAAKIISTRYPNDSVDKKHARLWIKEAIRTGKVIEFRRLQSKNKKFLCLEKHQSQAFDEFPPADLPTHAEERFVQELLADEGSLGCLDRRYVAKALASRFEGMNTPFRRNQVLMNAQAYEKIYVCKGPFLNVIGLTKEQAEAALPILMEKLGQDESFPILTNSLDPPADGDSGIYAARDTNSVLNPAGLQKEETATVLSKENREHFSPEASPIRDDIINNTPFPPTGGYDDANSVSLGNESSYYNDSNGGSLDSGSSTSSSLGIDLSTLLSKAKMPTRSLLPSTTTTGSILIKEVTKDSKASIWSSVDLPARGQNNPTTKVARTDKIFPRVDENKNKASRSLHVTGFGDGTTEHDIYRLFKPFSLKLEVVHKSSGAHNFMFVNTALEDDAIQARMDLYGKLVNGGCLKINFGR